MNYLYTEKQRFTQWWVWVILIGVTVLVTGIQVYAASGRDFRNSDVPPIAISVTLLIAFLFVNLKTRITEQGIEVKFFPFHLSFIKISWEEINTVEVRSYSPLSEYGGWGIKYGFKSGKAYNVSGNKGIQLVLKDGSKLLIGTNKEEEVRRVLSGFTEFKD